MCMKKFCIITFIVLLIDRISKIIVMNFLDNKLVHVIKNFFYLTYVKNDGAAFSILSNQRLFLILISLVASVLLYLYVKKYNKTNLGYSFLMGGIIGNLIDRILYSFVIDFIGVIIFNYNFPIFNFADSFIVIGAIMLLFEKDKK